jgi:hypothetical protein
MKTLIAAAFAISLSLPGAALAQSWDANEVVSSIAGRQFLSATEYADSMASIRVVRLSSLAGADNVVDRLAEARDIKASDIRYLQSQLRQNFFARVAMNGAGVDVEQIVAIWAADRRSGVIYADDL